MKIPANKAALAASSPVFAAMFYGHLKERGDVKITDASPEAFQEFLQFFSQSEVKLTMNNVSEVLKLADKYDVNDCSLGCSDFMKKNAKIGDIIWTLHLAVKFNLDDLKQFCEQKIYHNHKTVFDLIDFERGRFRTASDSRLSDTEMKNIISYLFAISKNIISEMSQKLQASIVPVLLTKTQFIRDLEVSNMDAIEFTINERCYLTGIILSEIAIITASVHEYAEHSFEMTIAEKRNMESSKIVYFISDLGIGGSHFVRKIVEFQPPVQIKPEYIYTISFKSDNIPQGLSTFRSIIQGFKDAPVSLTPSINIRFLKPLGRYSHSLISQLNFMWEQK